MGILSFEKPKKIRSTEEHNKMYSSDQPVPGTYVPNMSTEDRTKWRAKHIKGKDERIEIRKNMHGVNMVIVVSKNIKQHLWREHMIVDHLNVSISANGKIYMDFSDFGDFQCAIREAMELLEIPRFRVII